MELLVAWSCSATLGAVGALLYPVRPWHSFSQEPFRQGPGSAQGVASAAVQLAGQPLPLFCVQAGPTSPAQARWRAINSGTRPGLWDLCAVLALWDTGAASNLCPVSSWQLSRSAHNHMVTDAKFLQYCSGPACCRAKFLMLACSPSCGQCTRSPICPPWNGRVVPGTRFTHRRASNVEQVPALRLMEFQKFFFRHFSFLGKDAFVPPCSWPRPSVLFSSS